MGHELIDRAAYDALSHSMGPDFMPELVEAYLEDTPVQIAALRRALASGEAETFRRAAHSIKSTSKNFGASSLAEQARELEILGREARLEGAGSLLDALEAVFEQVRVELKELNLES